MTNVALELSEGMDHGAHRVRFEGSGSVAAWNAAMAVFRERVADLAVMTAWNPREELTMIAHDVVAGGALAYLAGSTQLWYAQSKVSRRNRSIDAVASCLARHGGRLDRVVCESRPLETAGYERTSRGAWPWRIDFRDPEVREVRPIGTVSAGQLHGLAHILSATVREWADLTPVEVADPPARVMDDRVELAVPVGTGRVAEHVYIWWQVCWVELAAVQLGRFPEVAESSGGSAADELRELVRSPAADPQLLPRLESLLSDHSPAKVSTPDAYADVAFLAAHALAATRTACQIDEPVVARGVGYPLDTTAVAALCTMTGLDPRGTPPLEVVRVLMSRGVWPLADLEIPGELRPRDPARLAALMPPASTVPLPPRTVQRIDDREIGDRIEALAAGDAAARRGALPLPLAEASASAELRAAIEACLDDRLITLVDWFGTAPSGRGPWLGELGWAAAWSLAWERRVARISDPVILEDVLVPVARAEAERIAGTGPNASPGYLIDAIGRERANLPRRRLVIRPDEPFRPDEVGVTRLRTAIVADDSARIEVLLDSIAGGHWDDPRYEPMLVSLVDRGGALGAAASAALDALRAVLRPPSS